ncbi:cytochrome P450 [Streptomyces sp. Rer75]|uniref:cytochrome P450 n=1 Tax=unclassified Streptomyces TaxID=2593676 RepID=UPI0015D086E5|nr:cytochrome P450 [Streptomyces sp. Rer75]QLH26680.1 cytochrome P450 [Streptomyces sp. Rer75]
MASSGVTDRVMFDLPDLSFPLTGAFPRDDALDLVREVCVWSHLHGLVGPRGRDRMETSGILDVGLALTGGGEQERALLLMQWFVWTLVLDDRVDDGQWADDGVLKRFAQRALCVLRGRHDADGADEDPMLKVLAEDLLPRTRRLLASGKEAAFVGHVGRHLEAQCRMVGHRVGQADTLVLTLEEYPAFRADLFGVDILFDLIELVHELQPPNTGVLGAGVSRLRACAGDVLGWVNDLYSLEKDLLLGENANLVKVAHRQWGCSWQQAVDGVRDMICDRVSAFEKERSQLPGTGGEAAEVRRLAEVLAAAMADVLAWHQTSSRYHWHGRPVAAVDTRRTPLSLMWTQFERDPFPVYARLRAHFPLMRDEPLDAWVVSRYRDVRAALCDPRFTSDNYSWQSGPMVGRILLEMNGSEHTAHRAVMSPAFRGRALTALRGAAFDAAEELAGRAAEEVRLQGSTDLVTSFCQELPIRVMTAVLGLPVDDAPRLRPWYNAGMSFVADHRQDPATLQRGLDASKALFAYLEPHIDARRAEPGDDLLSALCTREIDGRLLTDREVQGTCSLLLAAGADTSEKALALFLTNLVEHPDTQTAVADSPDLLEAAWAESLRRDPPTHVIVRQTAQAVDLPSGTVPAGSTVACLLASANRDPEFFSDPDRFDVHRPERIDREFAASATHLAFGAGRHFCLGAHLARLLGQTVSVLLRHLPGLQWADGFTPVPHGLISRTTPHLKVTARL